MVNNNYLMQLVEYGTVTKRLAVQVCRHHAAAVAEGCGHAAEFTCPYHGCALWFERCWTVISAGVSVSVDLLPSWKLSLHTHTKQTRPTMGHLNFL